MPRRVFSFDNPDRFVCGALGQPGQRSFYIQAAKGSQTVSLAIEKAQVALLAERLATLLLALQRGGVEVSEDLPDKPPALTEPVVEEFRVGTLTLGWDGEAGQVVIEARELGEEEDEDEADEDDEPEEAEARLQSLATRVDDPRDVVRVQLEPQAALAFASGALDVVRAGRPPCPNCGAPLEPTGHFCPRRNGHGSDLIN